MDTKKWIFIINPAAGNGYAAGQVNKVKEIVKLYGLEAAVVLTERKGHATEIARDFALKGYRHIVAVGGDGTFNETVQSIVDYKNVTFGAVSAGSGNDFINVLGFSEHFTDNDWKAFFEMHTAKLDVGLCNKRYFINGMGFGFDAQVALGNYEEMTRRKGAKSNFWWHVIKNLLFFREKRMKIYINGEPGDYQSFLTTIGNGRRFGGGFSLTPLALANDGLFDICFVKKLSLPLRVYELLAVLKGRHIYDKAINYFQTDKIRIVADEEVAIHLDGEIFSGKDFDVSILPSKLNIIYNPHRMNYLKF